MDSLKEFIEGKSAGALMGLMLGVVLVLGGAAFATWHVLRVPQAALFTDLPQADAAEIAAKLEEWKTPHRFSTDGREILVAQDEVHALRMRLVSAQQTTRARQGQVHADRGDFLERRDRALQLALQAALVVDLLGELGDPEIGVLEQLEPDAAATRDAF